MRELWLRTVSFLRMLPVLWLPVLCAAAWSYGCERLAGMVLQAGLRAELSSGLSSPGNLRIVAAYGVPVLAESGAHYLSICGFIVALFVVAKMLGRLTPEESAFASFQGISGADSVVGVLWLSLLTTLLALGVTLLFVAPTTYFAAHLMGQAASLSHPELASRLMVARHMIALPEALLVYATIAAFIAPMAVRLLRGPNEPGLNPTEIRHARQSGWWAGGVMVALSAVRLFAPRSLHPGSVEGMLRPLFWTVLIALPYAPLFIALSLLAAGRGDSEGTEAEARGLHSA